jgi:hypothetical protein
MNHIIFRAQKQRQYLRLPWYETASVGWRVQLFSILSVHSEMTIEQTDLYIPVPIRPSYGSWCQSSTVTKEVQVRYQLSPCSILDGKSVSLRLVLLLVLQFVLPILFEYSRMSIISSETDALIQTLLGVVQTTPAETQQTKNCQQTNPH